MLSAVLGTDWLVSGSQIAVAVGTLALAGVTWRMVGQTKKVAERTNELAETTKGVVTASLREAQATESLALEAKTDRQLVWLPQLELMLWHHSGNDFIVQVRNTGAGPAFQVACVARAIESIGHWSLMRIADLRPGEDSTEHGTAWSPARTLTTPFEGVPGCTDGEVVTWVLLCSDALGRRFRFANARAVNAHPDDTFLRRLPPDISAITDDHPFHEGWADEPMIWG